MMQALKNKWISIVLLAIMSMTIVSYNQAVSYRIFTIGDSTVQDYNAGYAPRKGWGQMLQSFFNTADVQVINKAVGGTSSRSFYNSFWSDVKGQLKTGDYVFIQFGINDRAADEARRAVGEDFKGFLRNYVNEARAKGAIPVLVSTVRRIAWSNGTPYDSYHEHPQLVREVAAELNVPLIDLDAEHKKGMIEVGQLYSERLWSNSYLAGEYPNYPNGNTDQVHFQEMGAIQLAKYVVEGIQKLSAHADMKKLIPFLKPQYTVTVKANIAGVGLITRTASYPAGLNIHLKAIPNSGHTFLNWKNATGTQLTTNPIYQFTMGSANTSYTAYFDSEGTADCAGVINGTATLDKCNICSGGTTGKTPCVLDCNGVQNGTAKLDNCGVCTGGNTNVVSCTSALQGEEFCSADGILEATNLGFMGAGYLNLNNAVATKANYYITAKGAQSAKIGVRYANGSATARGVSVSVNGSIQANLTGNPTASWTTWNTEYITLNLINGVNAIVLTSLTADGASNIDLFAFSSTNISAGGCTADCNGVIGGSAFKDSCGTCVAGNTGKTACVKDCFGNWGGTAYLDNCSVCVGANSGFKTCTASIEAETACVLEGTIDNNNTGFTGTGFANTDNMVGATIAYVINSPSLQTATVSFRYANGGTTSRDGEIIVNGKLVSTLNLAPTGSWTTWLTVSVNLNLIKGLNNLSVKAKTADGLANVDVVHVSSGLTNGNCVVTGVEESLEIKTSIYPNPTKGKVYFTTETEWILLNQFGELLSQGTSKELNLENQIPGVYILKVEGEVVKIIKE
jgi:lysophospholipase L1-like esterase